MVKSNVGKLIGVALAAPKPWQQGKRKLQRILGGVRADLASYTRTWGGPTVALARGRRNRSTTCVRWIGGTRGGRSARSRPCHSRDLSLSRRLGRDQSSGLGFDARPPESHRTASTWVVLGLGEVHAEPPRLSGKGGPRRPAQPAHPGARRSLLRRTPPRGPAPRCLPARRSPGIASRTWPSPPLQSRWARWGEHRGVTRAPGQARGAPRRSRPSRRRPAGEWCP